MERIYKIMDGSAAAAHVSYAFTEVAAVCPIAPSGPMADAIDQWSAAGRKNLFGAPVKVEEMQSAAGAAGAVHGALNAGALATTCTASQGLLLMIPDMYKMAGELLPAVFHVTARAVAGHALSIFGDQSDVMACRQTGFALLCENDPQEVMDLAPVAHLAAIAGRVPFVNFFDGFRTSHELQKVAVWDYADLAGLLDRDAVAAFRARALNPNRPVMRGSHENGDIFFQNREASNGYYDALPAVVEASMARINAKLGTDYRLFNYCGAPDADRVLVAMGSVCDTAAEVVDYLNARGEKVGLVKVRLYRPFCPDRLAAAIPPTARRVAVLDRTREPGAQGEPLYLDVVTALFNAGRADVTVCGGRYGLGSKDTPPADIFAVYAELLKAAPRRRFTVGIEDDVTGLSLPISDAPDTAPAGTLSAKFWGLNGDGTVSASKNSIRIIGDRTDKFVQAYFQYDSKKTGGVTVSHLRFGDRPIGSPYYVKKADFVACHNPGYLTAGYRIARDVKPGGTLLVNCGWSDEELAAHLSGAEKRHIARNHVRLYAMDAIGLARSIGMGKRTDTILQAAFFALSGIMPLEQAAGCMKEAAVQSYQKKGQDAVDMNCKAIDAGTAAFRAVPVPAGWADAPDDPPPAPLAGRAATARMVETIQRPVSRMDGDSVPVSAFLPHADGTFELGGSRYEKRGVAVSVPSWDQDKCLQCNNCAFSCPHAALRPFMLTPGEAAAAPKEAKLERVKTGKGKGSFKYTMAVSPLDCLGCGVCVGQCPTHALEMRPAASQAPQIAVYDYLVNSTAEKPGLFDATVRFSQYRKPLLEYSGACAGCAETSYARVVTQLFGRRMIISNATGCSSVWGGPAADSPYTVDADGRGPAWANSLCEDNAEHGLGVYLGHKKLRDDLRDKVAELEKITSVPEKRAACRRWLDTYDRGGENEAATAALIARLEADPDCPYTRAILPKKDYLAKKSVWIFGGDGWACDIGCGGLDHVLASGEDVNALVFDTEMDSDTGGQASKASNIGQVCRLAAAGRELKPKPLAEMAMTYGYVYVAQVAMGADKGQTLKALTEAEAYPGPSLVIAYSPCELHAMKGGMQGCQREMDRAVKCGYWNLFRFDPSREREKLTLDSREPSADYRDFLMGEARFASLSQSDPARAEALYRKSEENAKARYQHLLKLKETIG
ncbi:MAG TPA: pyruvate:ferredoxin (flavodoxin) oxidoreductase [Oscillospiraceae bacterium]|nr:pyruvate:ferredoxin (flavodoxin) oxidoreductase [Oscillospiraceae bacterium]